MKHASWLPDPDTLTPKRKEDLRQAILKSIGPLRLPVRTILPQPKQEAFLRIHATQKFYGGAAGGGKSVTLMMAASRYVDVPGYAALLLRRTYAELSLPGGLIDQGHKQFGGTAAVWNQGQKQWTFPGGSTITFGYLKHEADKYRYKSSEFQFIGLDELTHFTETQYTYMFSRLRRPAEGVLSLVPLEICSGSNPGGPGHAWVKRVFVDPRTRAADAMFMPAKIDDNRKLDRESYIGMLSHLPSVERDRLLEGDWDAQEEGQRFWAKWFTPIDSIAMRGDPVHGYVAAPPVVTWLRSWDFAATEPSVANPEPDWTVGVLWARHADDTVTIADVKRVRVGPAGLEAILKTTAEIDGRFTTIRIEQEPGASGKVWAYDLARRVLAGFTVITGLPVGSKDVRARPLASAAERGMVFMQTAPWNHAFLDELQGFDPRERNQVDDQVDAASSGYSEIMRYAPATIEAPKPGRL